LVVAAVVWQFVFRPMPGLTGDRAFSGLAGFLAMYALGVVLWTVGKGYRPLYGLLLVLLGPLGLFILVAFPSRER